MSRIDSVTQAVTPSTVHHVSHKPAATDAPLPKDTYVKGDETPHTPIHRPHLDAATRCKPVAGTPEPAPKLSAGTLQSPKFLGTEAEYFKEAHDLIDHAKSGDMVCLQMYEFENGATNGTDNAATAAPGYADQQALLPSLADAAKRGVKVDLVLDNSWDSEKGEASNQPVVDYLKKNAGSTGNLQIDYYPEQTVNIDHAKELIHLTPGAKGEYKVQEALVGGSNWGNHTAANDDGGGAFYGRDAVGAADIFFRDQAFCRGDNTTPAAPSNDPSAPVKWLTTAPTAEGGGSQGILEAKLKLTQQADSVYVNQFCFTHQDLVKATADKGHDAHVRLDPNELMVNKNALWTIRKSHGQAEWANTTLDPNMAGQKNHEKLDVYADKGGVPFALTIGSANDTSNGLDTTHVVVNAKTNANQTKKTNHEIDAQVDRVTDGNYSTAPFLDAALAKTQHDLAQRSLDRPPDTLSGTKPGQF